LSPPTYEESATAAVARLKVMMRLVNNNNTFLITETLSFSELILTKKGKYLIFSGMLYTLRVDPLIVDLFGSLFSNYLKVYSFGSLCVVEVSPFLILIRTNPLMVMYADITYIWEIIHYQ